MIPLIKSTFYNEEKTKRALCRFIDSADHLSFGQQCQLFEKEFAKWQGRRHCIMLNSGSSANLAIIQALLNLGYLSRGDAVGFSALTWSTNVMPLIQLGLTVIPVDVELDTLNVSSRTLRKALKKQSFKLLFLTNLLGLCDDIDEITALCGKNKIILIEDNCESLGTVYRGKKLGNFGLASTFSFYVGHHMSTIEGGAICTDSDKLATMLRLVRAHGWDRNLSFARQASIRKKFKVNSTFYSRYAFYDLGYNFRPTEISGFIGRTQIHYLPEIIRKRKENFFFMAPPIYALSERYYPIRYEHIELLSNFAVPVVCRTEALRDELVRRCDNIIEIRPIVGGDMTQQPFFHTYAHHSLGSGSNAKLIHERGLYFGNNPELTEEEMKVIIRTFTT